MKTEEYYECNKCRIEIVAKRRWDRDIYHYKYCNNCVGNVISQIDKLKKYDIAHNECQCGGTYQFKILQTLQIKKQDDWGRRDSCTYGKGIYRYPLITCYWCHEKIKLLSVYATCTNNNFTMPEHKRGRRICFECLIELNNERYSYMHLVNKRIGKLKELLRKINMLELKEQNGAHMCLNDKGRVMMCNKEIYKQELIELNAINFNDINKCNNNNKECMLNERLSETSIYKIFEYAINNYINIIRISKVNKLFHSMLIYRHKKRNSKQIFWLNNLWKRVCFIEWSYLKYNQNVHKALKRRWDIYYRIRFEKIKEEELGKRDKGERDDDDRKVTDIEDIKSFIFGYNKRKKLKNVIGNCDVEYKEQIKIEDKIWDNILPDGYKWDVKCPLFIDKLKYVKKDLYYCNKCEKNVYVVKDSDELKQNLKQKHCIAIRVSQFWDKDRDHFGDGDGDGVLKWRSNTRLVKGEASRYERYESDTSQ
eukprot:453490_1